MAERRNNIVELVAGIDTEDITQMKVMLGSRLEPERAVE